MRAGEADMASSKNIGDQIRDAVQDAVSSQDFSTLQSTIEKSIGIAAENIGRGLAQASDGIRRAQQEYALEQQKRQIELQMKNLYVKPSGMRAGAIALTGWGAVLALPGLVTSIIAGGLGGIPAVAASLLVAVVGGAMMVAGIQRLNLVKRFETYRDIIGLREFCYLEEIAARSADSQKNVLKNVKSLLSKGFFKQAALDDSESFLIMTSEAYAQYRQARAEALQRQRQQNLVQSVEADKGQKKPLTPEAQALLARGEAYVAKIRMSNEAIPGEEISRKIDQIEHVVRTIFERAEERPEVIGDLGQLMDYYLPTTVKLLDAYRELDAQPIQGANIQKSKREIEGALDSLGVAFEKLLDSVFREMAWDVSTDISVLHTVLSQEGLVESPFDTKPKQ